MITNWLHESNGHIELDKFLAQNGINLDLYWGALESYRPGMSKESILGLMNKFLESQKTPIRAVDVKDRGEYGFSWRFE